MVPNPFDRATASPFLTIQSTPLQPSATGADGAPLMIRYFTNASPSVADGPRIAAPREAFTGIPVCGSKMCAYATPLMTKGVPRARDTETVSSRSSTVPSDDVSVRASAILHPGAPWGAPIAALLLRPKLIKAWRTPRDRRKEAILSTA